MSALQIDETQEITQLFISPTAKGTAFERESMNKCK